MKEEFKTEELRQTATEIKEAVRSKSVTADMVGGTLLGLVNAVGEVVEVLGEIPREHVKVKVYGFDGERRVSTAGGVVILDVFTATGFPSIGNIRSELVIDENEEVEFDVPRGYGYAVHSKVAGLGASMQITKTAANETNSIKLYNLPIGVYYLWVCSIGHDAETEDAYFEYYPFVSTEIHYGEYFGDLYEESRWFWRREYDDNYSDEQFMAGILVSTADTAFVIEENNKSSEEIKWCDDVYFGQGIPSLPMIGFFNEAMYGDAFCEAFAKAQDMARQDFDGNLNTAKILAFCQTETAARWAVKSKLGWVAQRFLPSAGQLVLMQENYIAINALMQAANDEGAWEFVLLPYKNDKGQWVNAEVWWSSTQFNRTCSWVVTYYGGVNYHRRHTRNAVRAVSAFHFEY